MHEPYIGRSGLAAMIGGVLVVILTLLETYAFHGETTSGWVVAARPIMEPIVRVATQFAGPDEVLYVFGRPQGFAFLLLLLGYRGLHARLSAHTQRLECVGYRLAMLALCFAFVGNIGDMWIGKYVWGTEYEVIAALGAGLLVLGAILLGAASIFIGIAVLRTNAMSYWTAWLLIITGMLSVPIALVIIQGLSAVYLLFGLAWIVVGYTLWRRKLEKTA